MTQVNEVQDLRAAIWDALKAKEYVGLLEKVSRYLELKPDDANAGKLKQELERRQKEQGSGEVRQHDVFLSHSTKNKTVADAVCATLEGRGIRCWVAPRDIPAGANWGAAIIDGIAGSKVMVVILTSDSNISPQVMREAERAVNKGISIIPLRIEDIPLSKELEYFLSAAHWLDAFTSPLQDHLDILADRVKSLLSGENAAPVVQPAPAAPQISAVDIPADVLATIKEKAGREHSDDHEMQKMSQKIALDMGVNSYLEIKNFHNDRIPGEVLEQLRSKVRRENPDDYPIQQISLENEVESYLKVEDFHNDRIPGKVLEQLRSKVRREEVNYWEQNILLELQVDSYLEVEDFHNDRIPGEVKEHLLSKVRRENPDDYLSQKVALNMGVNSYLEVDDFHDDRIPGEVLEQLRSKVRREHPDDYLMQKIYLEVFVDEYLGK